MRHVLLPLLLLACKGDSQPATGETGTPTDPPATEPPATEPCGALIVNSTPANQATDVSVEDPVSVQFNAPIADTDNWSIGITGVTGVATLAENGESASFLPDVPLDHETNYAIEANVCEDGGLFTFTTGPEPLADEDIEGKTYAAAFPNIAFTSPPPGVMDLVAAQAADWILVQIEDIDDTTRIFTANAGAADSDISANPVINCTYAFDAGGGDFSNSPEIQVGPTVFTIPLGTNNIIIEEFQVTGTFSPDGERLDDLHITGGLDTRGIIGFGDICFLAQLAGATCVPCTDGAPRCLNVDATAASAENYDTLDIAATCAL